MTGITIAVIIKIVELNLPRGAIQMKKWLSEDYRRKIGIGMAMTSVGSIARIFFEGANAGEFISGLTFGLAIVMFISGMIQYRKEIAETE